MQALLATRQQFHQSRFMENLEPLNPNFNDGVGAITQALTASGMSSADASQSALGQLYQMTLQQASMQGFIDCFWVLMVFVALVLPTVFFLKRSPSSPRKDGGRSGARSGSSGGLGEGRGAHAQRRGTR